MTLMIYAMNNYKIGNMLKNNILKKTLYQKITTSIYYLKKKKMNILKKDLGCN